MQYAPQLLIEVSGARICELKPAVPYQNCVTLGKFLSLSMPQFPQLKL